MERIIQIFICSLISLLLTTNIFAAPPAELAEHVNNSYICVFSDDVPASRVRGLAKGLVLNNGGSVVHYYTSVLKGFSARMSATAAENIEYKNPNIAYCDPNGLARAGGIAQSGAKGGKGGKPNQAKEEIIPEGVLMVGGPVDFTGMSDAAAWVLDSGIDLDNPDLNVDASRGRNFVSTGKNTIDDGNGHGTHVAGTIGAIVDNDMGVAGVAAGVTVIPVRVLHNSNWAAYDDMIAGMDYVAGACIKKSSCIGHVANMSIWTTEHVPSLHAATEGLADVMPFVVIAGNYGEDINLSPSEPAHVEHDNLYTVSAVDFKGNFTDFSNYGWTDYIGDCSDNDPYSCGGVDIAAPGKDIISLQPGGGLATWYGTSMAAPHVAGVILLSGGNAPASSGFANKDPDSNADPIACFNCRR